MMDDGIVDINADLTSTVSDVLLSEKNDKTDANDSTPTSSTDASSSFFGTSLIVSEDPISSTSSDVMEKEKLLPDINKENPDKDTVVPRTILGADGDVDLLDMNIANVSSEPIIEDVEDIVQDLENLLGEPEPQHDFPTRRKEKTPSEEKELLASLDDSLGEKTEPDKTPQLSEPSTEKIQIDNSLQPETKIILSTTTKEILEQGNTSTIEEEDIAADQQNPIEEPYGSEGQVKIGQTEEIIIKKEEVIVATSCQLDSPEAENEQSEHSKEASEDTQAQKETNEINAVTSSETNFKPEDSEDLAILKGDEKHKNKSNEQNSTVFIENVNEELVSCNQQSEGKENYNVAQLETEDISISQIPDDTSPDVQTVSEMEAVVPEENQLSETDLKNNIFMSSTPETLENTSKIPTNPDMDDATSMDPFLSLNEEVVAESSVETPKPELGVDGNVTSSSDLLHIQDSNVITEEVTQEIVDIQSDAETEEIVSIVQESGEIVGQETPESEISSADQDIEQQNTPSPEEIAYEENITIREEISTDIYEEKSESPSPEESSTMDNTNPDRKSAETLFEEEASEGSSEELSTNAVEIHEKDEQKQDNLNLVVDEKSEKLSSEMIVEEQAIEKQDSISQPIEETVEEEEAEMTCKDNMKTAFSSSDEDNEENSEIHAEKYEDSDTVPEKIKEEQTLVEDVIPIIEEESTQSSTVDTFDQVEVTEQESISITEIISAENPDEQKCEEDIVILIPEIQEPEDESQEIPMKNEDIMEVEEASCSITLCEEGDIESLEINTVQVEEESVNAMSLSKPESNIEDISTIESNKEEIETNIPNNAMETSYLFSTPDSEDSNTEHEQSAIPKLPENNEARTLGLEISNNAIEVSESEVQECDIEERESVSPESQESAESSTNVPKQVLEVSCAISQSEIEDTRELKAVMPETEELSTYVPENVSEISCSIPEPEIEEIETRELEESLLPESQRTTNVPENVLEVQPDDVGRKELKPSVMPENQTTQESATNVSENVLEVPHSISEPEVEDTERTELKLSVTPEVQKTEESENVLEVLCSIAEPEDIEGLKLKSSEMPESQKTEELSTNASKNVLEASRSISEHEDIERLEMKNSEMPESQKTEELSTNVSENVLEASCSISEPEDIERIELKHPVLPESRKAAQSSTNVSENVLEASCSISEPEDIEGIELKHPLMSESQKAVQSSTNVAENVLEVSCSISESAVEDIETRKLDPSVMHEIEETKEITTNVPENVVIPSVISDPKLKESHIEKIESKISELPERDELLINMPENTEGSVSISNENIVELDNEKVESLKSSEQPTVDSFQKFTEEENLLPVDEPLCVKKVIIYEHDCHSHKADDLKAINEEDKQEITKETEKHISVDPPIQETEKLYEKNIASSVDSSISDKMVIEKENEFQQNEASANMQEIETLDSENTEIEETREQFEMNNEISEQLEKVDDDSEVFQENLDCYQTAEVSSSNQQNNQDLCLQLLESTDKIHQSGMLTQSSTDLHKDSTIESSLEQNVEEANAGQTMEDQTSAAVQSILDNMLTEQRSMERIIEKEETPVVHSSYSSYEVQKAVQEIQGMNLTEEIVEMSSDNIDCISSSEKPVEARKTEVERDVENISDQNEVVETQMTDKDSEEIIISKPEEIQAIEHSEYISPSKIFGENIETTPECTDDPLSNTDPNIKSSNDQLDQNDPEVQITEQVLEKYSSETKQEDPVVVPSIDLSEESSSEDCSDEDKKQNVVSSSVTSTSVIKESHTESDRDIKITTPRTASRAEKVSSNTPHKNESKVFSPRETRHSSRISEKTKPHNLREDMDKPLSVNIDEMEREKPYSPKITIKPIKEDETTEDKEEHKGSLKITITKQSDNTHSILKMCSPDVDHRQKQSENEEHNVVPKLVIKTMDTHSDQHSPKISTRSCKQALPTNSNIRSGSPRITIKPIVKPESRETVTSPLKITIKPIGKPEEFSRQQQRHSPKQTKNKGDDDHYSTRSKMTKTSENSDVHSPKVTIKPVKPPEDTELVSTPKITIKPIEKHEEARVSPKITIKPVLRPVEVDAEVEEEVKERIVLKINKGNLPAKDTERIGRESRKRELEEEKSEKLAKIKLKFSKDGDAHIVHKNTETHVVNKRQHEFETERSKRFKTEVMTTDSDDDVKLIENRQSPIVISEDSQSQDSVILIEDAKDPLAEVPTPEPQPQVTPVSAPRKRGRPRKVPLVVREDFGNEMKEKMVQPIPPITIMPTEQPAEAETTGRPKRSCRAQSVRDTLGIKPRKPSKPRGGKRGAGAKSISFKPEKDPGYSVAKIDVIRKSLLTEEALHDAHTSQTLTLPCASSPAKVESKKEEPIKPLGLKSLLEAAKDQNIIEVIEVDTPSNSPKHLESTEKIEEDGGPEENLILIGNRGVKNITQIKEFEIQKPVLDLRDDDGCNKEPSDFGGADAAASDVEMQPPTPVFAPPLSEASAVDINSTTDIAMFEEETRMSADASSRAQTPAKQVVSADVVVEESQSSIQSTATTESGKISRRSRLEVHQDQDGSVFTADQLNEYYWGGNGPFMIQEQVAQFLGIKSFKRKYPGIPRRMVDMQERDYIRENGLASESMCDLGLTAVNSADILDIMYTDFQEKYEEFCRFQRDKQAKDLLNKQRALSLAANQEKSKLDILEQAVQSAAAYNASFNKARREQRRACMDLQTMNIHYPRGKLKKINMPKIGHYPVAVVPGQFTDYYKEFTPTELNNLPLNTMLYTELHKILPEVSESDSDSSGSDSDDSSSSGSDSNSSCEDNCKMCEKRSITPRKSPVNSSI